MANLLSATGTDQNLSDGTRINSLAISAKTIKTKTRQQACFHQPCVPYASVRARHAAGVAFSNEHVERYLFRGHKLILDLSQSFNQLWEKHFKDCKPPSPIRTPKTPKK
eukprot:3844916-Amphidinium_carterae.1